MSTLATTTVTAADIQKTLNPNGTPARMINMLKQNLPIIEDIPWEQTNDKTSNRTTAITSLPEGSERVYNEGTGNSKFTSAQFVEGTQNIDIWSELDADMVDKETDPAQYRVNNGMLFQEGLHQMFNTRLLYGNNSLNAKQINGFATRYNSLSAENGENIVDGGGTQSDNTSMLLIGWGPMTVTGLYPQGTPLGLRHKGFDRTVKQNVGGVTDAKMEVYLDHWSWDFGLSIKDWQYVVRVANIDVSSLRANAGAQADLIDLMILAEGCIPNVNGVKLVWYVPRMVWTHFRRQARAEVRSGGGITWENIGGKMVPFFGTTPVRRMDGFSIAEARVT